MAGTIALLDFYCCDMSFKEGDGCGHREKLYSDIYRIILKLAMEHLIGNIIVFVKHGAADELVGRQNERLPK